MGFLGLKEAHFFVWTPAYCQCTIVNFSPEYFEELKTRIQRFLLENASFLLLLPRNAESFATGKLSDP